MPVTTVRVVCNNTLSIAVNGAEQTVKVSHRSNFDADAVKRRLGIAVSQWDQFMYEMKVLSERKVNVKEANRYFETLLSSNQTDTSPVIGAKSHLKLLNAQSESVMPNERAYKKLQAMYGGQGRGAELSAAKDTAWGLLCAVTEFVDHERQARSTENRLDSAWFGNGGQMKQKALVQALQLVA